MDVARGVGACLPGKPQRVQAFESGLVGCCSSVGLILGRALPEAAGTQEGGLGTQAATDTQHFIPFHHALAA